MTAYPDKLQAAGPITPAAVKAYALTRIADEHHGFPAWGYNGTLVDGSFEPDAWPAVVFARSSDGWFRLGLYLSGESSTDWYFWRAAGETLDVPIVLEPWLSPGLGEPAGTATVDAYALPVGQISRLEDWAAGVLAALTIDGQPAFRTAAPWRHQLTAGAESFARYAPFAFAKVEAIAPRREGGYDLNLRLRLAVGFGTTGTADGDARLGSATRAGCSLLADVVRAGLEGAHPGEGFDCDEFYFAGLFESVEAPKFCAMEMQFESHWMVYDA